MDGFLFILSEEAKFIYVSESISSLLGLSQILMIGTRIKEYIHEEDLNDLYQILGIQLKKCSKHGNLSVLIEKLFQILISFLVKMVMSPINEEKKAIFTIRFKSNLSKKNSSLKQFGWRVTCF